MTKKIAFVIKNPKKRYSGGRIYALTIVKGLLHLGYTVDYYTNCVPVFYDEIIGSNYKGKINLIVNKYLLHTVSNKNYSMIFLVPHLNTLRNFFLDKIFFYGFAKKLKFSNLSRLIFIDFESPSWVNHVDKSLRSKFVYRNSDSFSKYADEVISISKTGKKFATKYYSKISKELRFHYLYPPINSDLADKVNNTTKVDEVLFFARFDGNHKSPNVLFNLIKSLPKGYTINLITNKDLISDDILKEIEVQTIKYLVKVNFLDRISDLEKFKYLAKSKLLIFSSKFEGFGLPPVEAQYMNTPVICSDLPVLREVNSKAIFDDFNSLDILKNKILKCIDSPPKNLKESVESFAKFDKFAERLKNIL
jgi:glycosyltransferase involved in cell wall biosynthesis